MKKQELRLLIASCLFVAATISTLTVQSQDSRTKDSSFDLASLKSQIANYKSWTVVNPQPAKMSPQVAQMCANVATPYPHGGHKYLRVYVNDVGRDAMFQAKNPRFPVGTIIVKEKLPSIDST